MSDRRPLLILGSLGAALVLVLAWFLLFSGGDEQVEAEAVPSPVPTVDTGSGEESAEGAFLATEPVRPAGRSLRDPFEPVLDETDGAADSGQRSQSATSSNPPKPKPKPNTGTPAKRSFTDTGTNKGESTNDGRSTDDSGTKDKDNGRDSDRPKTDKVPIEPQIILDDDTSGMKSGLQVHLISVTDDTAVVKVDGTRITLYVSVPDASGVTYVSKLSGGCAWLSGADSAARVSVCEGETASL